MTPAKFLLAAALLLTPLLAPAARADNVTASQVSAAGHGRRPILTNRPSRAIYHRGGMGHRAMRHRHRMMQ